MVGELMQMTYFILSHSCTCGMSCRGYYILGAAVTPMELLQEERRRLGWVSKFPAHRMYLVRTWSSSPSDNWVIITGKGTVSLPHWCCHFVVISQVHFSSTVHIYVVPQLTDSWVKTPLLCSAAFIIISKVGEMQIRQVTEFEKYTATLCMWMAGVWGQGWERKESYP